MDSEFPEIDPLASLRNALGNECPECGEVNPSSAKNCEFCGSLIDIFDDEEESFTLVQNVGIEGSVSSAGNLPRNKKIAVDEVKYIDLLEKVITQLEDGKMSLEEYKKQLEPVLDKARVGVAFFSSDEYRESRDGLPADQKQLAIRTAELFDEYLRGALRMMKYDGRSLNPAYNGFDIIETALLELNDVQNMALELVAKAQKKGAPNKIKGEIEPMEPMEGYGVG